MLAISYGGMILELVCKEETIDVLGGVVPLLLRTLVHVLPSPSDPPSFLPPLYYFVDKNIAARYRYECTEPRICPTAATTLSRNSICGSRAIWRATSTTAASAEHGDDDGQAEGKHQRHHQEESKGTRGGRPRRRQGAIFFDAYKDLLQALLGRMICQLHSLIAASHPSHARYKP